MSTPDAPQLPDTPSFYQDPFVQQSQSSLFNLGTNLTSGDMSGLPSWLQETMQTNPQITQLMLQGLQAQLAGPLQTQRQDTINQLEANNQLTGSTTASALGQIDQNYTNQLVAAGANAGIQDINRALSNRVSLFGAGLNTLQNVGQAGLTNQSQINSFNLSNYENQVSKVLAEQKQNQGGLLGGLTGGLGGALVGFGLAPFTGGASLGAMAPTILGGLGGGLAGAFGPAGTGGQFLNAGAMVGGYRGQNFTASNNPFQSQFSEGMSPSALNYYASGGLR